MSKKRRKLRAATGTIRKTHVIHDRRAQGGRLNADLAVVEVEDAYGLPEGATFDKLRREWVSPGQPKVQVIRNLRGDPLGAMRKAGQLDEWQYLGGIAWQMAHQNAELGAVKGIDFTKEAVDGGGLPDPLSERQRRALRDLARARNTLGASRDALVRDILGNGMTIMKASISRGIYTDRGRRWLGQEFRECLRILAELFGIATRSAA